MQPPGAGAQTSSTAATAMTTSVTHGSSTFPRQPVHHTHMGSHMPPQHVQQPPSQVPPPVPPEQEVTLSEEQENILDLVRRRKNVFFTGAAGTGKSVLLREIIKVLTNMYSPKEVAITAPTGVAGLNIGGRTIHSWAGVGYGKESVQRLYDGLSNFKKMRWRSTKALIIDESTRATCYVIHYRKPFGVSLHAGRQSVRQIGTHRTVSSRGRSPSLRIE
ncbi:hypothetical protein M404DRAFT_671476 [Pisolithus tinctorius Marx 270]|uniref:ATP-dependent DNA helicase n=1 Tax=Pisolithus tinctorius Marx 270 TaxID=870435 RepID=A0A0C3J052_PISTI|nr:hypothetical protein M404DRAFT_671476 [Pisolithus tinctorius Marx 270]